MMKIKTFICGEINNQELQKIEKEINDFTATHDVVDVKITSCCNSFGSAIIYGIVYREK